MNAVRTQRSESRTWRMKAWPSDATVAHLIFVDHLHVPTPDELAAAVDHARRKGARAIRTSAMFPDVSEVVCRQGFEPIDRLALLTHHLGDLPDVSGRRAAHHRTGPLRTWHLARCAGIDRDAFGLMWGNSPASLRDIRHATPVHRGRVVRLDHQVAGFAISGAAAGTGYLQRLAVASSHRRRGLADALVRDALGWMQGRGLSRVMVNTGVSNDAALGLYHSLGFTTQPGELTIGELGLT